MIEAILTAIALLASYVIGWRHGFEHADHPHRRKADKWPTG